MKLPTVHTSRQTTVALTTLFVVGLLFAYYFLIHTKTQENRLKKQAFNHLVTLSVSFKDNLESHKIAIVKLLEGNYNLIFETFNTQFESQYEQGLDDYYNELEQLWQTYKGNSSLENLEKLDDYSFDQSQVERLALEKLQDTIPKTSAFSLISIKKTDLKDSTENIYNIKQSVKVKMNIMGDSILFTSTIRSIDVKNKIQFTLLFYTDLQNFIAQTFNHRIFDDFILISNKKIKYQSMAYKFKSIDYDTLRKLNREVNYLRNIIENFKEGGSSSNIITDESLVGRAVSASNLYDINISETGYKLFLNQFIVEGNYWVLCGFINADTFNQQKRAVEPSFLLIIITVLFFILLASQLIKLFISSAVEQYYIHNIIFSVISITLGASIIVISLLTGVSYWIEERNVKDQELKNLNNDIQKSFTDELTEVVRYVQSYDKILSDSGWFETLKIDSRRGFENKYSSQKKYDEVFENTFWIDKKGDEIIRIYERTKPLSLINVSTRDYFRKLEQGKGYKLNLIDSGSNEKFYFQPVKSWITGKKIVVASIKSKGDSIKNPEKKIPTVAAMATQFRSLQNCILPNGFGFIMINESGKVLFHDDDRLSLSENFLKECTEINELQSAILSRIETRNSISYHNKKYRIYLKAIPGMPLFLITYHEREYLRLPGVLIFYYTILFSLIGLMAVCFWVLFLLVFNFRGSKMKYKNLILNWAFPDNKKNKWYWKATLVNLIATTIISLFVLLFSKSLTHSFLMIFLACNFIFPINYFLLKKCPGLKNEKLSLKDIYQLVIKGKVTIVFMILLTCFNMIMLVSGYEYWFNLLFYQAALLTLLFFPFYLYKSKTLSSIYDKLVNFSIPHSYTSFTLSWIILVSIVPTIFYYDIVKTNEKQIWGKYDQLQIIKKLHDRKLENTQTAKVDKGIYVVYDNQHKTAPSLPEARERGSAFINSIFYHLRLPIVDLSELSKSLVSDVSGKARDWNLSIEDKPMANTLNIKYTHLRETDSVLVQKPQNMLEDQNITSESLSIGTIVLIKKFINTLLILIMIGMTYTLLYYLLKKVFGFEFLISDELISSSKEQIQFSVQNRDDVFVIGLPAPDFNDLKISIVELKLVNKSGHDQSKIELPNFTTLHLDLQQIQDIKIEELDLVDKDIIIVDHFEYACDDLSKLRNKLTLIEYLKREGKQIVIFSHVSPRQIDRIYQSPVSAKSSDREQGASQYHLDKNLWSNIMTSFQVLHYRLERNQVQIQYASENDAELNIQLSHLIKNELKASTYFKNVEHLVHQKYLDIIKKHDNKDVSEGFIESLKEEMILYIQDIAQTYYYSLWNTCYKNQRFLLYDLAYDGIANFKDGSTVLFLMKKGLLKYENGIQIMNKSFKHFVIDAIGEQEAMEMRQEMQQKGTWSSTRIVLIIVAISLIIFIFLVNKGSINQVSAIITGSVALIGGLLRLFTFGSGSSFVSSD